MADDLYDVLDAAPAGDGQEPAPGATGRAKVRLRVHVRPGSGKTAVVGTYGHALHVRVAAPPVAGRANDECVKLLADSLGIKNAAIELSGGEKSADKRFVIEVEDVGEFRKRLHELVEDSAGRAGTTSTHPGKHRPRR
jgi:uncharacterized protein (TIGR00251 family)